MLSLLWVVDVESDAADAVESLGMSGPDINVCRSSNVRLGRWSVPAKQRFQLAGCQQSRSVSRSFDGLQIPRNGFNSI